MLRKVKVKMTQPTKQKQKQLLKPNNNRLRKKLVKLKRPRKRDVQMRRSADSNKQMKRRDSALSMSSVNRRWPVSNKWSMSR